MNSPEIRTPQQFVKQIVDGGKGGFKQSPLAHALILAKELIWDSPKPLSEYTLKRKLIPDAQLRKNPDEYRKILEYDKHFNKDFIRDREPFNREYAMWKKLQNLVQYYVEQTDPGAKFVDYVAMDADGKSFIFYYYKPGSSELTATKPISPLSPIFKRVFAPTHEEKQLEKPYEKVPGITGFDESVKEELEILQLQQKSQDKLREAKLMRLAPTANELQLQRNSLFAEEGEMFTNLQYMGAASIGEIQDVVKAYYERGLDFDPKTGKVAGDPELLSIIRNVGNIALSHDPQLVNYLIDKTAREKVYFKLFTTFLKQNPAIVTDFLKSDIYRANAKTFKDFHFAAYGQAESTVAAAMLTNYFLMGFEGAKNPEQSVSQKFLSGKPEYFQTMRGYVESHLGYFPALPDNKNFDNLTAKSAWDSIEQFQTNELIKLAEKLKNPTIVSDIATDAHNLADYDKLITKAHESYEKIGYEMARHPVGNYALKQLKKFLPIIEKSHGTQKLMRILISNIAMARVHDKGAEPSFTALYMPRTHGYLPDAPPAPQIGEIVSNMDLTEALSAIFTKQSAGEREGNRFTSQRKRIYEYGGTIIARLQNDPQVPESVRQFFAILGDEDQFIAKMLERFDPGSDALVVNRFFPNGFSEFYQMTRNRFLEDFVRGIETQLISRTQGGIADRLRKTIGGWRAYDFSQINPDELNKVLKLSIAHVLNQGEHRLAVLNKEEGVKRTTWKDWQEFMEKYIGWNTDDMKFLRWEKFWDVWHLMGTHWGCICFLRKTLFNADMFQQM